MSGQFDKKLPGQKLITEKINFEVRKKILWLAVAVLMLIIIIIWLVTLPSSFVSKDQPQKDSNQWQELRKNFEIFFTQTKQSVDFVKKNFTELQNQANQPINQATTSTTTVELNQKDIDQLKEKLKEKLNNN